MKDSPNDSTAGWPRGAVLALQVLWLVAAPACATGTSFQRDTSLAAYFSEAAERIEARARAVDLARSHDVRMEHAELRDRMQQLSIEMMLSGPEAWGPGQVALGRGALALGDLNAARLHVEAAWSAGFHEPSAAWTRALVLSQHYREQRVEALTVLDPDQRRVREQDVDREYREPVLALLRQARGKEAPSADYGAALVALHEDRLDAAADLLEAVAAASPWFVEAPLLRADVLLLRSAQLWEEGHKDAARAQLENGRKSLAAARSTAESRMQAHLAQVRFESAVIALLRTDLPGTMPSYDREEPVPGVMSFHGPEGSGPAGRAFSALDAASRLNPAAPVPPCLRLRLLNALAEHPRRQEAFNGHLAQHASEIANVMLARDPTNRCVRLERLRTQVSREEKARQERFSSSMPSVQDLLKAIPPAERGLEFDLLHARILEHEVALENEWGGPRVGYRHGAHRDQAINVWKGILAREYRVPAYWVRFGELLVDRSLDPLTVNGAGDLDLAEEAWDKAGALRTKAPGLWLLGAHIQMARALAYQARGEATGLTWKTAEFRLREGLIAHPREASLHHGLGQVLLEQAKERWASGGDPTGLLDAAEAAQAEATTLASGHGPGKRAQADIHALRAEYAWRRGEDPSSHVDRAEAFYLQAMPEGPTNAEAVMGLMRVLQIQARFLLEQGRDPRPAFDRGGKSIDLLARLALLRRVQYLRLASGDSLLLARWTSRTDPRQAELHFDAAEAPLTKALENVPRSLEVRLDLGEVNRSRAVARKAAGQDAEPLLAKGLALADALLKERPNWPEALLLRAAILRTKDPASPQAREDRDAALKANTNLAPGWRRQFPEDGPPAP
ncbi:serine/threonine protein kinase [Corallococcus coralloides DSM 2259]|uniref:Serine/threonine protein kinase n=1 Tax=Corallococcus coralloides (strain ATCC 25202 / DSM 2259 / NBRC 100086 / M2) TaxID=1144275 RepID=H8MGV7_CORCM|nr:hypothetical protein [Corallococcus coralloides]AFE06582.1 serine/threonine protein kinase [Corallococcus coralloides DSM 2259]